VCETVSIYRQHHGGSRGAGRRGPGRRRSGGRWAPSPGAVYPAINQLEDEGLVTVTASSSRKVVALTDAGRQHVEADPRASSDMFAEADQASPRPDLRDLLDQLHGAARQVGRSGTDAQIEAGAAVLTQARRSIYLLLADASEDDGR
jgi:DNA-binding PadR family transcriptional regulator